MRSEKFTLKSGVVLQVSLAPFESSIELTQAVKRVTNALPPDTTEMQSDQAIFASAEVRKALYPVFDTVLYGTVRVTPGLFDDPEWGEKARGDYFEICSRVIQVNCKSFFLTNSSSSTTPPPPESKSPESQ